MKWQLVDRIDNFEPWSHIGGAKLVTLEEYHLLEPFGSLGELPPSLVLESIVHLTRWLIMASSDFQTGCVLVEIPHLEMRGKTGQGDTLILAASVIDKNAERLKVNVSAEVREALVCEGTLIYDLFSLSILLEPNDAKAIWTSLNRVVSVGT